MWNHWICRQPGSRADSYRRIIQVRVPRLRFIGVAVLQGEKIAVKRSVGKLVNLQNALKANGLTGTVGIGHTRWATHGKPSEQNAHPHRSKGCVLVHNGIIENYQQLKQQLEKDGYKFVSETDTEVVAHLIDKYLQKGNKLADAVRLATKDVKGSYALAVMSEREPNLDCCTVRLSVGRRSDGACILYRLGCHGYAGAYAGSDLS